MGEVTSTTFTILLFVAAFLGAGAYAVLSIADFRAARRGFWATATSFAAIGLVLGLMTTWPLPVRIIIAAAFGAVAIGSLTWVLDYLRTREGLGISEANQPDIIMLSPTHTYKVGWNATSNLEITFLPARRDDETEPLKTMAPIFQIKNIGSALAKSVTIDWDATAIDIRGAVHDSDRLKGFSVKFTDTHFGIFSGNADDPKAIDEMNGFRGITSTPTFKGYYLVYSQLATTRIPYMAPEINNTAYQDAILPPQIIEVLGLYVVAAIVDRPPSSPWVALPPLFATIRWQNPENGKPLRYRIDSRMLNTKAYAMVNGKVVNANANVEAELEFTIASAP